MPSGGQRGTTIEVTAAGNFPKWPVQAWVDRPGLTLTPGDKGKLTVSIAADAAAGVYWIRLPDADGSAAPRPFIVGTLPEVNEQEPNNRPAEAQPVSSAVVVNGRFGANGDVDMFAVDLEQGQTLVASLSGHESLGSPMDSVLEIVSTRGDVLAFNHDQHGLDPQIEFTAPSDGPLPGPRVRLSFDSQQHDRVCRRRSIRLSADADHEDVRRLSLAAGGDARPSTPRRAVRLEHSRVPASRRPFAPTARPTNCSTPHGRWPLAVAVETHDTRCETEPNDLPDGRTDRVARDRQRTHREACATSTCFASRLARASR